MLGTIINCISIIFGGILGASLKKGLPERFNDTIMKGLALCVILIGISGTMKSSNTMIIIFSIVIGGIIGEAIDIDSRLKSLGDKIELRLKGRGGSISEGFVTASLVYCVGAMAIVGSLESGLTGNHKTLLAKSILDGVSAVVFSSSLGIGVVLSAVSVFIYQGTITVLAEFLRNLLVESVVNDMTAVGSLLIIGLGLNMIGATKVKVANLLPGVFFPIIYFLVRGLIL